MCIRDRRHAKEILQYRDRLNGILAECTGQPLDRIAKDSDRDFFMSADEAVDYGLIDDILSPNSSDADEDEDDES